MKIKLITRERLCSRGETSPGGITAEAASSQHQQQGSLSLKHPVGWRWVLHLGRVTSSSEVP